MNKHSAPTATTFARPQAIAGSIPAATTAALLAKLGDVALILDADGVIRDIAVNPGELANHGLTAWVGEAWVDTVTVESRPKIVESLAAARGAEPPRWRQVNHPAAGGDVPIEYLTLALGNDGRTIAIGRDLRAQAALQQRLLQTQQSLERDYIQLRQTETRYRQLFDIGSEALLLVDVATRRIREANLAAHRLLDRAGRALIDEPVTAIVDPAQREDLIAYLGAAEAGVDGTPLAIRLPAGTASVGDEVEITARLLRQGRASLYLLRLAQPATSDGTAEPAALRSVVERMPDAFVLVDHALVVQSANAAFLELTAAGGGDRILGERLGAWLGRPGIDLELIVGQLREHGAVRNVATIVRDASGVAHEVEVSAVAAPSEGQTSYGFVIRSVARRLRDAPAIQRDAPRSVEQLTELVGRVSLKDIVRESTDLIERLCIEAALAYTADNRASAAEILGVSRQSLYSKLHRHGLGNLVPSGD